jgi:hypothetical protein
MSISIKCDGKNDDLTCSGTERVRTRCLPDPAYISIICFVHRSPSRLTLIVPFSLIFTLTLHRAPRHASKNASSAWTSTVQNRHPPLVAGSTLERASVSMTKFNVDRGSLRASVSCTELRWPLGSRLLHVRHFRRCVPADDDDEVRRTGRRKDFGRGIGQAGASLVIR